MAIDFEKLKARLAGTQSQGQKSDVWWKPQFGEQTLRLLPTKDGDPFKDYWFHYNMGKHSGFLCPKKNFDEDCPVCDFASQLWHGGNESDKELAKTLFARQRFFAIVVEREDNNKLKTTTPKIWGHSKTVYETLINHCLDPDYGDITDIDQGNDVKVTYEKKDKVKFPVITLKIRPKKSKLCSDLSKKECDEILNNVPDVFSHLVKKTSKEIEQLLNEWSHESETTTEPVNQDNGVDYKESKKPVSENPVDAAFDELLESQD
jgi:hypothetical protein